MNNNIIGLFGYTILTIVYIYFLSINIKEYNNDVVSSSLLVLGYSLLSSEKYNQIKNKKETKKSKGHIMLLIFYILSLFFTINEHSKNTDIFALVGHYLLINKNNYYNIGLILMIIYYMIYCYRNSLGDHLVNKFQIVASLSLICYYLYELNELSKKNKLEEKNK